MENSDNAARDYKVLVIDDNILTLTLVTTLLEKIGITQIETANDGEEAWDKISAAKTKDDSYDILILDWNMPVLNGYDVLRRCREDKALDRTAIVMLSAQNHERNILEAMKAGATAYMVKPVNLDEFKQKMDQVFLWIDRSKKPA